MGEKVTGQKNNDCYFYYYSSCSKGEQCPFRHEPAALRNETMCIYWLKGTCNKSDCIFRHMQLVKKRDRIACWFETQPGGCKKPHCPFQHQNIQDHPREEDIKKKPDLILPVCKAQEDAQEANVVPKTNESTRQVLLPSSEVEVPPRPPKPQLGAIMRTPIIVPLQDGESDSESVSGISGSTPKRVDIDPRLSAQLEWELKKLRQIQEDEANLIGYTFEDEDEVEEGQMLEENGEEEPTGEELGEIVVEEVLEVDDQNDAAHRRLKLRINDQLHVNEHRLNHGMRTHPEAVGGEDMRHNLLKGHGIPRAIAESKIRQRIPITQRLGGIAGRALEETLGDKMSTRKSPLKRLTNRRDPNEVGNLCKIAQRFSSQSGDKRGIVGRLGGRANLGMAEVGSIRELQPDPSDRSVKSRIGIKRREASNDDDDDENDGHYDGLLDSKSKRKSPRSSTEKNEKLNLDFTIKSLADIRAEKQNPSSMKRMERKNGAKNVVRSSHSNQKDAEGEVKVKTLAEIRAAKNQVCFGSATKSEDAKKRPISPISFSDVPFRKLKNLKKSHNSSPEKSSKVSILSPEKSSSISNSSPEKSSNVSTSSPKKSANITLSKNTQEQTNVSFSSRKLALRKSPPKSAEEPTENQCIQNSEPSIQAAPKRSSPAKTSNVSSAKVQTKKSAVKVSQSFDKEAKRSKEVKNHTVLSTNTNKTSSAEAVKKPVTSSKDKTQSLNRLDSLLDEEEEALLLGDDGLDLEDEDIDEAALLL